MQDPAVEHKSLPPTLAVTTRTALHSRQEIRAALAQMQADIPPDQIAGPPICTFQFVTSVTEGYDVELAIPVRPHFRSGKMEIMQMPEMDVLSTVHRGPPVDLQVSYRVLRETAAYHGLISDEFCREVYHDLANPEEGEVEVQFVLHNWGKRLRVHLERVLGETQRQSITPDADTPNIDATLAERFQWVKGVLERLEQTADEVQRCEVLSSCAHVFPQTQIDKLRSVYQASRADGASPLDAVDAVIQFMEADLGWGRIPERRGRVILSSKAPCDPAAYKEAQNDRERRQAACFCPLVRARLEEGMPHSFCYCGGGWFRQQWEGATGKPVRIEIIKSVLHGHDECRFAVHLPEDL